MIVCGVRFQVYNYMYLLSINGDDDKNVTLMVVNFNSVSKIVRMVDCMQIMSCFVIFASS